MLNDQVGPISPMMVFSTKIFLQSQNSLMAQFHTLKQIWKLTGMVSTLQNTLKIEVCIHFHANFMVWYYHLLHTRITAQCSMPFSQLGFLLVSIEVSFQSIFFGQKSKLKSHNLSKMFFFDIKKTQNWLFFYL